MEVAVSRAKPTPNRKTASIPNPITKEKKEIKLNEQISFYQPTSQTNNSISAKLVTPLELNLKGV